MRKDSKTVVGHSGVAGGGTGAMPPQTFVKCFFSAMNCVSRPVKSPGISVSLQKWREISRSPGNVKKSPAIEVILLICT